MRIKDYYGGPSVEAVISCQDKTKTKSPILREYFGAQKENWRQCYVKIIPLKPITVKFFANFRGRQAQVDLVIDGVIRASKHFPSKIRTSDFTEIEFGKVFQHDNRMTTTAISFTQLKNFHDSGSQDNECHDVGCIEIRVNIGSSDGNELWHNDRTPTAISEMDYSICKSSPRSLDTIPPTYALASHHRLKADNLQKFKKTLNNGERPGMILWGTLRFLYRSSSSIEEALKINKSTTGTGTEVADPMPPVQADSQIQYSKIAKGSEIAKENSLEALASSAVPKITVLGITASIGDERSPASQSEAQETTGPSDETENPLFVQDDTNENIGQHDEQIETHPGGAPKATYLDQAISSNVSHLANSQEASTSLSLADRLGLNPLKRPHGSSEEQDFEDEEHQDKRVRLMISSSEEKLHGALNNLHLHDKMKLEWLQEIETRRVVIEHEEEILHEVVTISKKEVMDAKLATQALEAEIDRELADTIAKKDAARLKEAEILARMEAAIQEEAKVVAQIEAIRCQERSFERRKRKMIEWRN